MSGSGLERESAVSASAPVEPLPTAAVPPDPAPAATVLEAPDPRPVAEPSTPTREAGSPIPSPQSPIPSPRSPAPATVRFDSRPPGATIYLNDVRIGVTPLTINTVAPGTHQVRLEMLGHDTWRTSVTVKEGEQYFLGASLE